MICLQTKNGGKFWNVLMVQKYPKLVVFKTKMFVQTAELEIKTSDDFVQQTNKHPYPSHNNPTCTKKGPPTPTVAGRRVSNSWHTQ